MLTEVNKDNRIMKIVRCMGDVRTFYEIASDVVLYMEEYLNTSHAFLMQKNPEREGYSILYKYDRGELYGQITSVKRELKLCSDKIQYMDDEQKEYADDLAVLGAKSCVNIPVLIYGLPEMYLLVLENERRIFTEEELEYMQDVMLILQAIAEHKLYNCPAVSGSEILKEILSNIGSGVVVFDMENKSVLFKNYIAENSEEHIRILSDAMKSLMDDEEKLVPKRAVEFFDAESGLWFDLNYSRLKWMDAREVVLISSNDTTLKKKNSTRSVFQAQNDFLTGLFNRMKCETDLKMVIDHAVKNNEKGAVLFIDLDNFKNINDSLGHEYGDTLLKEIGVALQGILGLRNHCYRMGGDEFVAIITPENYGLLKKILTNISAVFNKPWFLLDSEVYCTTSMGVVNFPEHGQDVNELIKKADIAMYHAKKTGKNRYNFYSEEDGDVSYRRLEVESNMRQAVEDSCEEFVVFYQPIVDTATNQCSGCESLIRWNSKALGFMGPGDFIPLAEYLGLIVDIGDFVLETACLQCKEWNDKFNPDFRVNVNLSVVQLLQQNVVSHIKDIILGTGVNPKNITLEITENLAINDMERVKEIIRGLKEMGVKIALDDFGTGYSSLNYIKQLDFDIIKIDKSFVDEILTDDYEKAFVKMIVDLSQQIGAKVCVEGVEEAAQYVLLKKMKADCIQGYYFSKPIPPIEFERKFFHESERVL